MQSLEIIKKRINSIDTTIKITSAMKMIAISKLQKFKRIYATYQDYFAGIANVFVNVLSNKELNLKKVNALFYQTHKIDANQPKVLYLVIGSDFGMCGPFNAALLKHLLPEINPAADGLYLLGTKLNNIVRSQQPH